MMRKNHPVYDHSGDEQNEGQHHQGESVLGVNLLGVLRALPERGAMRHRSGNKDG